MNKQNKKDKAQKLIEIRFWFESTGKKYEKFRQDSVYRAILEAVGSSLNA